MAHASPSADRAGTQLPAGLVPPPGLDWEAWRAHVRALKLERGLSINDLTMRSGLDRSTVIEALNGRRGVGDIKMSTLWALAWAFGVHDDVAGFVAPLFKV